MTKIFSGNFAKAGNSNSLLSRAFKLSLPIAIQSALGAFLGLTDVLMVSDLGAAATASVGIASKWIFVAMMIAAGICTATGTLVAQYWGKGEVVACKQVVCEAFIEGSKLLLPIAIIITIFADAIMLLQTKDSEVMALGRDYLWFTAPILLLTLLLMICETTLRSSDEVVIPLVLGTTTILLNIALNYWFIKGGFGIPALGVIGAALATTVSRAVQILLTLAVLLSRHHWLLSGKFVRASQALRERFRMLAYPAMANTVFWALGTLCYQMIYGHLGTTELAVFSMMGPFEGLCYSLFFGVSVACSVMLGQALGRDDFSHAAVVANFYIRSILFMGVFASALILMNKSLLLSFLNLDQPDLVPLASPAITLLGLTIGLRMLNLILINGILRAGGENKFCLRMDFIAMWLVGIPLVAFAAFVLKWSFTWVLTIMMAEEIVKFVLCLKRYRQKYWLQNLTVAV
ncbi:MATE family efflux transporter [Photobacterium rosenbergii]|uniref:MATE family efflux transporter n=1 Tax=Photobacterium rosenbergii TaxID=294936 RepID=UPI001C99F805|nr:MATE family efflux transporter [Photobacterium rosenbergii]MBY5946906.1 MATE family efflux transporter [Photobacterium rosenbergii]